jgi:hypothetical protein
MTCYEPFDSDIWTADVFTKCRITVAAAHFQNDGPTSVNRDPIVNRMHTMNKTETT